VNEHAPPRSNLRNPVAQVQTHQNIEKTPVFGQGAHVLGGQEIFSAMDIAMALKLPR
jgi:hypothetical protein